MGFLLRSLFCISPALVGNFTKKGMEKNNSVKKGKPPPEKPDGNTLEKEIDEMIDREKTRGKIVGKLLYQVVLPIEKSDN